jgi:hypothetical protein
MPAPASRLSTVAGGEAGRDINTGRRLPSKLIDELERAPRGLQCGRSKRLPTIKTGVEPPTGLEGLDNQPRR